MKKAITLFVVVLLIMGIIWGFACSDKSSDTEEESEAPDVPGAASMRICFSTFPEIQGEASARPARNCEHFTTAYLHVLTWYTVTNAILLLPRSAFLLAISQTPVYEGDSTFSWTFGVDTSNVKLTGQFIPPDSVEWIMYVTNNTLDNFRWFDGRCDINATSGWWQFYDPNLPVDSNRVIWDEWALNTEDTFASHLLTNVNEADSNYGDTVSYRLEESISYARLVKMNGEDAGTWNIMWHIYDKWGGIEYPDESYGCWDENLECIDCDSLPWTEPPEGLERPFIPPQASMRVSLTTFPGPNAGGGRTVNCVHYTQANLLVSIWKLITEWAFLWPRTAFGIATLSVPDYLGDSTWCWSMTTDTTATQLFAHLLPTGDVDWSMYVTNATLDSFLWFDGQCDFYATGGWWQFYDSQLPPDSNAVAWVEWAMDAGDTTAHFTMVNVNESDTVSYGDTLHYQLDDFIGTAIWDDIEGPRAGTWTIKWHIEDNWGSITYPEDTTGCWDDSLQCIDCDELPWP